MYLAPIDPSVTAKLSDSASALYVEYARDMQGEARGAEFSYEQNANVFAFVYGEKNGCECQVKRNRDGSWSVTVTPADAH